MDDANFLAGPTTIQGYPCIIGIIGKLGNQSGKFDGPILKALVVLNNVRVLPRDHLTPEQQDEARSSYSHLRTGAASAKVLARALRKCIKTLRRTAELCNHPRSACSCLKKFNFLYDLAMLHLDHLGLFQSRTSTYLSIMRLGASTNCPSQCS